MNIIPCFTGCFLGCLCADFLQQKEDFEFRLLLQETEVVICF